VGGADTLPASKVVQIPPVGRNPDIAIVTVVYTKWRLLVPFSPFPENRLLRVFEIGG